MNRRIKSFFKIPFVINFNRATKKMLCPKRVSQICQTIDINCRYNNQKSDTNGDKCDTPPLLKLKRALSSKDTNCISLYLLFSIVSLFYTYKGYIYCIYSISLFLFFV